MFQAKEGAADQWLSAAYSQSDEWSETMRFKSLPIGVIVILAAHAVALAQPLPDVVLYGSVTLDGQTVRADDDVTFIARVDGVA